MGFDLREAKNRLGKRFVLRTPMLKLHHYLGNALLAMKKKSR